MDAFANFARSKVATAVSSSSIILTSGDGAKMPAVPFNLVVWPAGAVPTAANAEIVRVTVVSTDTLTITRQQEGTALCTLVAGCNVANAITNKTMTDISTGVFSISDPLVTSNQYHRIRTFFPTGFSAVGTSSFAAVQSGPNTFGMGLGTTANTTAYCQLMNNVTVPSSYSGGTINFSRALTLYFQLDQNVVDTNCCARIVVGDNTVKAKDANPLTNKGFGFELRGSDFKAYLFTHDGTTYTVSATGVSYSSGAYQYNYGIVLKSNGAGNISLYFSEQASGTPVIPSTPSLTITGGPTSAGGVANNIGAYLSTTTGLAPVNAANAKFIMLNGLLHTV